MARSGRTRRQNGRRGCATAGQERIAARLWAATDGSELHEVPVVLSPWLGHVRLRAASESRRHWAASARPPVALTMLSEAPELLVAAVGRGLLTGTALLLLTHAPEMPKLSLQGRTK